MNAHTAAWPNGTLFVICGPSGVGKDTVLRTLRALLGQQETLHFARRVITRAADAGEENECISAQDFARRRRDGQFLLQWQAHGLDYGLPVSLLDVLKSGRSVIANLSRGSLSAARKLGVRVIAIEISASPEALAARLEHRGREDEAARRARLARNALYAEGIAADHVLLNDGTPDAAATQLAALILDALAPAGT